MTANGTTRQDRLDVSRQDGSGGTVLHLAGELDLVAIAVLDRAIDEVGPATPLVLDLSELRFCDSTGLGRLVAANNTWRSAGTRLALRSPQPPVHRLLDVAGLLEAFEIEDGATTAVA